MINEDLIKYIEIQKTRGVSRDAISAKLVSAGWQIEDVNEGLNKVFIVLENPAPKISPIVSTPNQNDSFIPNLMPKVAGPAGAVPISNNMPISNILESSMPSSSPVTSFRPAVSMQERSNANMMSTGPLPQGAMTSSFRKDFQNTDTPRKSSSGIGAFFITLFLLIVLAGGGAVFANMKGFITLPFDIPFLAPSPEQALAMMNKNVKKLDTFHMDTNMEMKISGEPIVKDEQDSIGSMSMLGGDMDVSIGIKLKTDYDTREEENIKSKSEIEVSFSAMDFFKFSTDTEVRTIGEVIYIKLPEMLVQSVFEGEKGIEWISLTKADLDNEDLYSTVGSKKYDSKKAEEVAKIFNDIKFVDSVEYLGIEDVEGEKWRHYSLLIGKENIKELFNKLIANIDDPSLAEKDKEVRDMINSLNDVQIDVWTGKGNTMRKFAFNTQMNFEDEDTKFKVMLKSESTISKINEDLGEVSAPSPVKSVSEVIKESKSKAKDMNLKAILSNTRVEAELYFDEHKNSYGKANISGSCTLPASGSIFYYDEKAKSTSSMVAQSVKEILEQTGGEASCYSTSSAWAISAPLPSDKSTFVCVDNTGGIIETKNLLKGAKCQ